MPVTISGAIDTITSIDGSTYEVDRAFPFGQVDATSTATAFTATIPGVYALRDGVCVYLKNGVITSASGFTLDINGLGAKPVYQTLALESRVTTLFNINYTMLFVYNSSRVDGGCWDMFYGYNSDTNTIAYNVRQNSAVGVMAEALTRYKIIFTKQDGKLLPSTQTSNSTGTSKTLTTTSFDAFGPIYYYNTTTGVAVDASPSASYIWEKFSGVDTRYGFNAGSTLVAFTPVYVRCVPQSDGLVKFDGNKCLTQTLPTTADEKVYIYLGVAYDTYRITLDMNHPVYEFKDGAIRLWTNAAASGSELPDVTASDNGKVLKVVSGEWAKADETKELPTVSASDNGKMLKVVSGAWAKADETKELPTISSSDNGKVLRVVDGQWVAASLPSATGVNF